MTRPRRVPGEKPLFWVGSSKDALSAFPEAVKDEVGTALSVAQFGGKHPSAKPWKGQGPGVFEIVEDHRGDAYRAVYTVGFEEVVYVLHVFQKKSPSGTKTARKDVELIGRRLDEAGRIMRCDMAKRKNKAEVVPSSGNVFADLGLPNAEEKQTKVRLAVAINRIVQDQQLSQAAAARRLNVNQPKVSALSNYQLEGFSVERLMNFLTALDRDVDIVIRRKPRTRKVGRILVTAA
jgi:phage-related protein/predicted XRE-type DNA-binding protein